MRSYWQLTKPRIIPLLLIETAAGMWVAGQGRVDPLLLIVTLLSGALAAASAQTIYCIYDRDIDYDMERTRHRPIPSGRIQPRDALIFALIMAAMSFALLATFANLLSAGLAMLGIAVYVGVYTFWLALFTAKHRDWRCGGRDSTHGGLGCSFWRPVPSGLGAVCHRLCMDAAPLLGVGHADSRRLCQGKCADAACGGR